MPVGRCSSKLSGHELQTKSKKSQALRMTVLPGVEKHPVTCAENTKDRKVAGSQGDVFVGVLTKNIPNKLALMGRSSGLLSRRPLGTALCWKCRVDVVPDLVRRRTR